MPIDKYFRGLVLSWLVDHEAHRITRADLLKKAMFHYESTEQFDEVMQQLADAGMIEIHGVGRDVMYSMPDEQVAEIHSLFYGKYRGTVM